MLHLHPLILPFTPEVDTSSTSDPGSHHSYVAELGWDKKGWLSLSWVDVAANVSLGSRLQNSGRATSGAGRLGPKQRQRGQLPWSEHQYPGLLGPELLWSMKRLNRPPRPPHQELPAEDHSVWSSSHLNKNGEVTWWVSTGSHGQEGKS